MPSAWAMSSAPLTKGTVINPTAGVPTRSELTASCKLHDEQLPQSPMPAKAAAQPAASLISEVSAGAE